MMTPPRMTATELFLCDLFWGAVETVRRDLTAAEEARESLVSVPGQAAVRARGRLAAEIRDYQVALAEVSRESTARIKRRVNAILRDRPEMWT